ncbi:hypothetical protein ACFYTQ_05170 [Nocardia sp. NPDC004068]|uniref:hypothetical protein n=1 Tax=Nocardia sp. NPDC004068 TaxID=3364303 RepID=UPI0036B88199
MRVGEIRPAELPGYLGIHGRGDAVRVIAVLLSSISAGLAIMMPISFSWFALAASPTIDLLIMSVPQSMAAGAMVAVIAVAVPIGLCSRRVAWYAAGVALAGMFVNHAALHWANFDSLSTLNYIDSLLAGVVIGAIPAAVWTNPAATGAYLFGCLGSIVLGDLAQPPAETGSTNRFEALLGDAPPIWLVGLAVVFIGWNLAVDAHRAPAKHPGSLLPLAPIVAGMIAVLGILISSTWLAHSTSRPGVPVAGVALVVVTSLVAALILPARDGVMLLLLVAYAASGSAVVAVPHPWWVSVLVVVMVAIGLLLARRWPRPWLALAASAALAAAAALTAATGLSGGVCASLGALAIGLVGGYNVVAALPGRATSAVVALVVLFVPSAGVALRGRSFGRISYSPRWYRLVQVTHDPGPALAALVITAGCAAGIYLLCRERPPSGRRRGPSRVRRDGERRALV